MNLLKTAVKARIPLIAVRTDDARNAARLIEVITGLDTTIVRWVRKAKDTPTIATFMNEGDLGVISWQEGLDWAGTNKWLEEHSTTLIIVNPETLHPVMMDAGPLQVPALVTREFIESLTDAPVPPLAAALSGLSITSMRRIAALATAEYNEFTPKSIRRVRRELFPVVRGLEEVDPDQLFYEPQQLLLDWLKIDGQLFGLDTHPLLTPRGFLFTGEPGTGKTSGAKFIAQTLKVPLYKLDLGMILGRYVGESDERLIAALRQADSFEPCVLLLDEVEKLFEISNTSDVIPRLLGHMLWWLQEHTSKVLTVMTTNDEKKIPPELYRAGRVDSVVKFEGLKHDQVGTFVFRLAKKLETLAVVPSESLEALAGRLIAGHGVPGAFRINQASATEEVLGLVKREVIKKSGVKQ